MLAICGVGKVAAAICCCRLLENFEIDYVVNIGTAGGIKEYENIADVMVADKLTYHDYDTSAFDNYSIGFAQNPYVFYSDEKLVKRMADEGHIIGNHTENHPSLCEISLEEVEQAIANDFIPVSLGESRLRTETAALYSVMLMNLKNSKLSEALK